VVKQKALAIKHKNMLKVIMNITDTAKLFFSLIQEERSRPGVIPMFQSCQRRCVLEITFTNYEFLN